MYPRALRSIFVKFTNQQTTSSVVNNGFSAVTLQKLQASEARRHFATHFDEEFEHEDEDELPEGLQKKHWIDSKAQKEVDKMLATKPEIAKLKKVIELEWEVMKQDGECVPSALRPRDWEEVLKLPSRNKRRKFFNYLFIIEKQKEKRQMEKLQNMAELELVREERAKREVSNEIVYGFGANFLLRRISDATMNHMYNWNVHRASMFGNKLVYDFSYEKLMTNFELKSCAKQIMESFAVNRIHNYPFEMTFCNVNMNGPLFERVMRFMPHILDDDFPIRVEEKSYLDLFDKSQVVYLSSDAPTMMEKYDPESIYIVGAYVDRGPKKPISMAKAKKDKIKMVKFPIDKYIRFGDGSGKDLTLNQCTSIMLDAQCYGMEEAMKHVPRRKLLESRVKVLERKIQKDLFLSKTGTEELAYDNDDVVRPQIMSENVYDFSHSARSKHRKQWNK
ncbi:mitochondrial ribonuclease P protein 1 homolog [Trichogramma pretiosum]|uniref:mitochondrial ribonuclease P protein 1 homolog n=1 Tax=Trichogramma pretiosum TaxID=7493 RepID=UPI0006C9E336|nr:mitochondrial ribonuclease P protein 1 homolog [Trichogramma pretiosum]